MYDEASSLEEYRRLAKRRKRRVLLARVLVFILFFGLWEAAARLNLIDDFITSSPSRAARTLAALAADGALWTHFLTTLYESVVGFTLGTLIGVAGAAILWWNERLRAVLEPYLIVLNALPKIALGPIIIVWIGAGTGAIIAMALLISSVVSVITVMNGFVSTDEGVVLLMRTFGATKSQIFRKAVLPGNIPTIVSSLKINVGMTWVGVIMGEYLVSKAGLGYLIVYGSQVFKLDLVMASTLLLCAAAGGMYFLVEVLERRVNRGRL